MKNSNFSMLIIIIIGFSCCEYTALLNAVDLTKQQVLFERYAINHAWGVSYDHWIIDNDGNIRVNKKLDSIIWIDPTRLNDYKDQFDSVIYQIDKVQLDKYIQLIPKAQHGVIHSKDGNKADFGSVVFNCFFYDGEQVKTILLSEESDLIDRKNLDVNAIQIDQWLKQLHQEIYAD